MADLAIDSQRYRLSDGQFYPDPVKKDTIVLHFTAGSNVDGAVKTWEATKDRVATAFIIDRDGSIYEVFPRSGWAWHVGFNGVELEKRSIGIEVVNIGPLDLIQGTLRTWAGSKFCELGETDRYVNKPWRGKHYFATFRPEQYQSISALLDLLCDQYGISREIRACCSPGDLVEHPREAKGILTHSNFRRDKWDIGPAFEWGRIVR